MSLAHNGLGELLRKKSKALVPKNGDVAIFINTRWTAVKMLTANGTILYVRRQTGINPRTIKYLPSCVYGQELNYKRALELAILEQFKQAAPRRAAAEVKNNETRN
jgi:hypothetical protein